MFFRPPERPAGLRGNPLNQLVTPRPIGWISSLDRDGTVNLAPYSFFNLVAYTPPQVMFAATGPHDRGGFKDSVRNIRETGEFVCNLATWDVRAAVNLTSTPAPGGVDELAAADLTPVPSAVVRPPRVAESPVHLECVLSQVVDLASPGPEAPNTMVIGEIVAIHVDDAAIEDGRIAIERLQPIARLGYNEYTRLGEVFEQVRPGWPVEE